MISLAIGLIYGLISGYFGGTVDNVMMRIVDIIYGFPFLIFVILLQVYFKAVANRGGGGIIAAPVVALDRQMGGMLFIFIALGALNWIGMARIARGQVLSYKEMEFIEGARIDRGQRYAHRLSPPAAQHPGAVHRRRDDGHPRLHLYRGLSQLYRPGRQRAHAQLGDHGQRGLSLDALAPARAVAAGDRAGM